MLPFDLSSLSVSGDPFPVAQSSRSPGVSSDGTLVYEALAGGERHQLVWVDRSGRVEKTIGWPQDQMRRPALSPNSESVGVTGTEGGNTDIWIHDVARSTKTRVTFDPAIEHGPSWSPSGDRIAFGSARRGVSDIFVKPSDGSGKVQSIVAGPLGEGGPNWSGDGKYLAYNVYGLQTGQDLWCVPLTGEGKSTPFLQTPFNEWEPRFSPHNRYLAYMSDESGQYEIYVRLFPSGEGKKQVSVNGGRTPNWSRQSNEIFYIEGTALMAVKVETQPFFRAGTPEKMFDGEQLRMEYGPRGISPMYDVAADGQHFVVIQRVGGQASSALIIVENWFAEFQE